MRITAIAEWGPAFCKKSKNRSSIIFDAPIEYVHSDEIPVPFNHFLEEAMMPSVDKIVAAVKEVCYR